MKSIINEIANFYGQQLPKQVKLVGTGFSKDPKFKKVRTVEEDTPKPGEVIKLDEGEEI